MDATGTPCLRSQPARCAGTRIVKRKEEATCDPCAARRAPRSPLGDPRVPSRHRWRLEQRRRPHLSRGDEGGGGGGLGAAAAAGVLALSTSRGSTCEWRVVAQAAGAEDDGGGTGARTACRARRDACVANAELPHSSSSLACFSRNVAALWLWLWCFWRVSHHANPETTAGPHAALLQYQRQPLDLLLLSSSSCLCLTRRDTTFAPRRSADATSPAMRGGS